MKTDLYATIREVQDELEEKRNKALTEHIRKLKEHIASLEDGINYHGVLIPDIGLPCSCGAGNAGHDHSNLCAHTLYRENAVLRTAITHTRDAFRRLREYAAIGHGLCVKDICSCGCSAEYQCGKKGCIHCDHIVTRLVSNLNACSNKED